MQQCQNHWRAWHILQCAQSRRSGRKEEKCEKNPANCAAAVVSRARRRLSMHGAAYSAGRAIQEVGQEGGKIASKIQQTAQLLCFRVRRRFSMGVWT